MKHFIVVGLVVGCSGVVRLPVAADASPTNGSDGSDGSIAPCMPGDQVACTAPLGPTHGSCSLAAQPIAFEPNPPGVSRAGTPYLGGGFNSNLVLYQTQGTHRLVMQESFGYSILELSNPVAPVALAYHDVRFPLGGPNSVDQGGDGQSDVQTIAVSTDGQRLALGMSGPTSYQTVVGSPSGPGFTLWGDFPRYRPTSTLIQSIDNRYIAYNFTSVDVIVSDITTLPADQLAHDNLAASTETAAWPFGGEAMLAGNYILYLGVAGLQVIDASHPGPIHSITAAYPQTTITTADFGGHTIAYYTAATDPSDPTKLWVLAELNALAGESSPSYGLLSVSQLVKTSAGPIWRVPSHAGEQWWTNPGISSALVASNGTLFVEMWAQRSSPLLFELYSTTVASWGAINTSAPPGVIDIPTSLYANFTPGQRMSAFASGSSVYAYLPTGESAYVIPMSCETHADPVCSNAAHVCRDDGTYAPCACP